MTQGERKQVKRSMLLLLEHMINENTDNVEIELTNIDKRRTFVFNVAIVDIKNL